MTRRLLVEVGPLETRTALVEHGEPVEFHVFPRHRRSLLGEIRLGRVATVDHALGALFVEIGLDRPGFLKRKDAGTPPPAEGAAVIVEVIREPGGTKPARLTARLADPARAAALAAGKAAPALLAPAPHPAARLALAAAARGPVSLIAEGDGLAALRGALAGIEVQAHRGKAALFETEGIEEPFMAALERQVPFGEGGRLTLDEVEALTAIDIDGGGLPGRTANEAAAGTVAAEIRRRNLGGQILIDFIGDAAAIQAGRQALARALAGDPLRPEIARGDLNGLILVTRPRLGPSLRASVTEACPVGDGRWLSPSHLAARLLRQAEGLARAHPGKGLLAGVPADVLALAGASPAFAAAAAGLGAPLRVEARLGHGRAVEVTVSP